MKYKTIQAIHEVRMCVTGIAVGAVAIATYINAHPESKLARACERIKGAFNKDYKPKEVIVFEVVKEEEQG